MDAPNLSAVEREKLAIGVNSLRDTVAATAGTSSSDKLEFMKALLAGMTRVLAMFRGDTAAYAARVYGSVACRTSYRGSGGRYINYYLSGVAHAPEAVLSVEQRSALATRARRDRQRGRSYDDRHHMFGAGFSSAAQSWRVVRAR